MLMSYYSFSSPDPHSPWLTTLIGVAELHKAWNSIFYLTTLWTLISLQDLLWCKNHQILFGILDSILVKISIKKKTHNFKVALIAVGVKDLLWW